MRSPERERGSLDKFFTHLGWASAALMLLFIGFHVLSHHWAEDRVEKTLGRPACEALTKVEAYDALNKLACVYIRAY